jgi:very-short-patch-repair endonuclease
VTSSRLTRIARTLRRNRTEAEERLWQCIRNRQIEGAKFVFQHPIGPHVADFACRSLRLVIELDGGQHADNPADIERTKLIEAHGYRVIRFWNNDVLGNTDGVLETIRQEILIARNH